MSQTLDYGLLEYKTDGVYYSAGYPFTGVAVDEYADGTKFSEMEFEDGRQNGITRDFFRNGAVKRECVYSKGILHGIEREWYDGGVQKSETHYNGGEITKILEWDEMGILRKQWHDPSVH